jgi:hypothetical protein
MNNIPQSIRTTYILIFQSSLKMLSSAYCLACI